MKVSVEEEWNISYLLEEKQNAFTAVFDWNKKFCGKKQDGVPSWKSLMRCLNFYTNFIPTESNLGRFDLFLLWNFYSEMEITFSFSKER